MARRSRPPRIMLRWALFFFVLALIAGFFGFGGVAASAAAAGRILFVGFLALSAAFLVANAIRERHP